MREYIAGAHGGSGRQRHLDLKDVPVSTLWGKNLLVIPINKTRATVGQFTVIRLLEFEHLHEGLSKDFLAIYFANKSLISTEESYEVIRERIKKLMLS